MTNVRALAAAIVVLLLTLTACSQLPFMDSGSVRLPSRWLAEEPGSAFFLQWSQTEQTVTGSLTASLYSTENNDTRNVSHGFTGVIGEDKQVSLTFQEDSIFNSKTWNGEFKTNRLLVVSIASSEGGLIVLNFQPGSIEEYNDVVATLPNRVADRVVQSKLRNGLTAEKIFYTENQRFTENSYELNAIDVGLDFTTTDEGVFPLVPNDQVVILQAWSPSEIVFCIMDIAIARTSPVNGKKEPGTYYSLTHSPRPETPRGTGDCTDYSPTADSWLLRSNS